MGHRWQFAQLLASLIAIVLFILAAQAFNMTVFQRLGGYDRATAFYCSAPGGLMESIALAKRQDAMCAY